MSIGLPMSYFGLDIELKAHAYANMFPMMSSSEHQNLVSDMKAHGFDGATPVILFQGEILDGRNRYKASIDAGVEALFTDFDGDEEGALSFVIRHNLHRRHLSETQRAVVASRLANLGDGQKASSPNSATMPVTQAQAADKLNIGITTLKTVKAVERNAPELMQQMECGAITANEATKIAKLDIEQRDEVMAAVNAGEGTATKILKSKQIESARQTYTNATAESIEENKPVINVVDCLNFNVPEYDILMTDPPYSTDVENIEKFSQNWLNHVLPKMKSTGRAYICIGAYPREIMAYLNALSSFGGLIVDNPLIWTYRNTLGVTPNDKYNLNYQMILHVYQKTSAALDKSVTNEMFSVQDINAPDGRLGDRYHTWQKPDELAMRFVRHSSKEGDLIFDPFSCTGTFLIAAAKMKRMAVGCEINHEHALIAKERGCELAI